MIALGRREFLLSVSALALAGCNGGSGSGGVSADDMMLGNADAPVTVIEYASSTCPHCAAFHEEAWSRIKENYIDTGRVRFVFREYPTSPAQVAVAGFQVARCGGASAEQYFTRVGEIFRTQRSLFESLQTDGGRAYFIGLGGAAGLSEQQVMDCITDESGAQRVRETVETGSREYNITGTPTFIVNGRKMEESASYENLSRAIEAALNNG